jgi:hypothetical protein
MKPRFKSALQRKSAMRWEAWQPRLEWLEARTQPGSLLVGGASLSLLGSTLNGTGLETDFSLNAPVSATRPVDYTASQGTAIPSGDDVAIVVPPVSHSGGATPTSALTLSAGSSSGTSFDGLQALGGVVLHAPSGGTAKTGNLVSPAQVGVASMNGSLETMQASRPVATSIHTATVSDIAPPDRHAAEAHSVTQETRVTPLTGHQVGNSGDGARDITINWSIALGGPSDDTGGGTATIANGNGTVDTVVSGTFNNGGKDQAFVARLDSGQNLVWSNTYSINGDTGAAHHVTTDSAGNIYVAATMLNGTNGNDGVAMKLDGGGNLIWSTAVDGVDHLDDTGNGIAIANNGADVWLAGSLQRPTKTDAYAARLDGAGNLVWVSPVDFAGSSKWNAIDVDPATSETYVAGQIQILPPDQNGGLEPLYRHYLGDGTPLLGTRFFDPGAGDNNMGDGTDVHVTDAVYTSGWLNFMGQDGAIATQFKLGDTTPDGINWSFIYSIVNGPPIRASGLRVDSTNTNVNVDGTILASPNTQVMAFQLAAKDGSINGNVIYSVSYTGASATADALAIDGTNTLYFVGTIDPGPIGGKDILAGSYNIT